MQGWIKLHRKCLESGMIKNHRLWALWTWCLMKASHKDHSQVIGYQKIELQPGQFVFGRKKAAEELGMSEQMVRTAMNSLKKLESLTIKTTNKYSIITIVNWDTYQSEQPTTNQQSNKPLTNKQPTTNHKQEGKEGEKGKEEIIDDPETGSQQPLEDDKSGKRKNGVPAGRQDLLPGIGESTHARTVKGPGGDATGSQPEGCQHEQPAPQDDNRGDESGGRGGVGKQFTIADVRLMRLPWWCSEEWEDLIDLRRKKKAAQTKRAYNQLIGEFEKAKAKGYTADEILNAMNSGKGWSGFKLDWMKEPPRIKNGVKYMSVEEKIYAREKECQGCDTMIYTGKCDAINTLLGYPCKERLEHVD